MNDRVLTSALPAAAFGAIAGATEGFISVISTGPMAFAIPTPGLYSNSPPSILSTRLPSSANSSIETSCSCRKIFPSFFNCSCFDARIL